jgi:hypothetical protein
MNTLFSIEPHYPKGFSYEDDFIIQAEETEVLKIIEQTALHTFHFQGYEAKRRVASFGLDWSFERKELSKGKDIPAAFHWLIERVAIKLSLPPRAFAQLLVTEYPIGSVINWHRDAPLFQLIAGISWLLLHVQTTPPRKGKANEKSGYFPSCEKTVTVCYAGRSKGSLTTQHVACSAGTLFHYASNVEGWSSVMRLRFLASRGITS